MDLSSDHLRIKKIELLLENKKDLNPAEVYILEAELLNTVSKLVAENELLKLKDRNFKVDLTLCDECNSLFSKAIKHLQECPHDPKPRCRKCPNPCYEKEEWKNIAKIMKYSGMKLGVGKVGTKLKKLIGFK